MHTKALTFCQLALRGIQQLKVVSDLSPWSLVQVQPPRQLSDFLCCLNATTRIPDPLVAGDSLIRNEIELHHQA
jgi:hypothetical protein